MNNEIKQRIEQIQNGEIPKGYKHSMVGIIPKDWEVLRLKDKFDRLSRKNAEGNTNVLTISAQYGLINQEEFFKKAVASDDKSNYYLLQRGEFAYNKSYSNGYPFGAIKRLSRYDKGVVSPLYICFSANADNACPEYYEQYFEAGKMNHEIQAFAQEGARNHGLLNISVSDFFNSFILVPPVAEQQQIAKILSTQDKIIECYEKKIEQLQLMKKYYLQNMFPKRGEAVPKIRFKGFTDAWEQRKLGDIGTTFTGLSGKTKDDFGHGDAKFVTYMNVFTNPVSDPNKVEAVEIDKSQNSVQYGDVFFTTSSETPEEVGMSSVWLENTDNTYLNSFCFGYRPTEKIDPYYIAYMLRSETVRKKIIYLAQGISRYNISKNGVMHIEVPLPDINEQRLVGEYFSNLDNLITLHQRLCDEEKKKKKALQQLLLTGIVRTNE